MSTLALHTWTLDTTPLAEVVAVIQRTGWDAIELRRVDYNRAVQAGGTADDVDRLVRDSRVPVACVGVDFGWMWSDGAERKRLLDVVADSCRRARALGCHTIMSPVDKGRGDVGQAAASVREVGDIAKEHGVRLALEFNSQADQVNTLEALRALLARAGHPSVGVLMDTYHLGRTRTPLAAIEDVPAADIAYVQFSDVPRDGLVPGQALDRLPPGRGSVPFTELFALLVRTKGYAGYLSYEAPNPAAWAQKPDDVAREALAATRERLPR
jgi:2-keto-myo-inositol isomerase